jgi:hypothetical protein
MHARRSLTFVFFTLLVIAACGPSPIFQNRAAADLASEIAINADKSEVPASACAISFKKLGVCGAIAWTVGPRSHNSSAFTFSALNKNGSAALPAGELEVELWMPAMGHGSAPVNVVEKAPGVFEVTNVQFLMNGEWEIRLRWKKNGAVVDATSLMIKF